MKIWYRKEKFLLDNDNPIVEAILILARNASPNTKANQLVPERNDIKRLWSELGEGHQKLLKNIADYPSGITQKQIEESLDIDWLGLRGIHNGLARICDRLGCEKPVRVVGYNASNRRYLMAPDVAITVNNLYKRSKN